MTDSKQRVRTLLGRNPEVSVALKVNGDDVALCLSAKWKGKQYGRAVDVSKSEWLADVVRAIQSWERQKIRWIREAA